MNITDESLQNLKQKDLYSIMLYGIYKCTKDPEYSTLSELIYTVDKNSLLNLCSVYGGCTIKIPTIKQLKSFSNGLLVYQLMNQGKSFSQAFKETGLDNTYRSQVAKAYTAICEAIKDYGK